MLIRFLTYVFLGLAPLISAQEAYCEQKIKSACEENFTKLVAKNLEQNRINVEENLYSAAAVRRSLLQDIPTPTGSYEDLLSKSFLQYLANLKAGEHWIDGGSGTAQFAMDYFQISAFVNKAKITAVVVTEPKRTHFELAEFLKFQDEHKEQFQYLKNRYMETYQRGELEPASLVTDVFGALSYTKQFDDVLKVYGENLKPGGRIYAHCKEIEIYTELKSVGASSQTQDWFHSIKGFKLLENDSGRLVLERTNEELVIPPLQLLEMKPGPPPARSYYWKQN